MFSQLEFIIFTKAVCIGASIRKIQDGGRPPGWIFKFAMYSLTCNKSNAEEDTTFGDFSCNRMKVMLSFPNPKWQLAVILDFGIYRVYRYTISILF